MKILFGARAAADVREQVRDSKSLPTAPARSSLSRDELPHGLLAGSCSKAAPSQQHCSDEEFILVSVTGIFLVGRVSWWQPLLRALLPVYAFLAQS